MTRASDTARWIGAARPLILLSLGLAAGLLAAGGRASGAPAAQDYRADAAPPGFGDRHNSIAWSMQWWRGRLYVGTGRSFICWRSAIWATLVPSLADSLYPPGHADADCAPSPADLPMRAEIWRWTPATDTWERVYQSPQDVPIPGHPGKFVARDIGYRGMLVLAEADGTEALYVPAVSAREMYTPTAQLPPPRLLRTTDGLNFAPVPQAPGTFLGDLPLTGLRSGLVLDGRMYLTNGTARGEGLLIESDNPAGGGDNFREVLPGATVWDAAAYNGFLYVGTATADGFAVVKLDPRGAPPYTTTTVITAGGYLENPSPSVVSFQEFQGRLYVGTYLPAELYRINPDDTWDLIVGRPRETPAGPRAPLSGLDPGFGWPYNVQIYRMHVHEGVLYLGTLDTSREVTEAQPGPILDLLLRWHYGFDLYRSVDGEHFEPLTINGFGDGFQVAARTFETTPYGMFLGTSNYWYGFRIWRLWSDTRLFLPMIAAQAAGQAAVELAAPAGAGPSAGAACASPQRLEAEVRPEGVLLSWESASRVRILRSDYQPSRAPLPGPAAGGLLPAPFTEIGRSEGFYFVDPTAQPRRAYAYLVTTEDGPGCSARVSNLVQVPASRSAVSLTNLSATLRGWQGEAGLAAAESWAASPEGLRREDLAGARRRLAGLRARLASEPAFPRWRLDDLDHLLARLERRFWLAEAGLIPASELD